MLARPRSRVVLLALVGVVGCAEEPSFDLRWAIAQSDAPEDLAAAEPLTSVEQCAEVGIERFRLDVFEKPPGDAEIADEDRVLVASRFYPCFPRAFGELAALAEGLPLAPGDYEVELVGLRRQGDEWPCTGVDAEGNETVLACAQASSDLQVAAGQRPSLEFVVPAPPQCDDGVDNDLDGRVDGNDLGCAIAGLDEGDDQGLQALVLDVRLLANDLVEPKHVGLDVSEPFTIEIDGTEVARSSPVIVEGQLAPWPLPLVYVQDLALGTHTLRVTGQGGDGPMTVGKQREFTVEGLFGFVTESFEFGAADFLAPIQELLRVSWVLDVGTYCSHYALDLTELRVKVGLADTPLPEGALVIDGEPGIVSAGWHSFACAPQELRSAAPLVWGDEPYVIEFEAYSDAGEKCFASGAQPTRPSGNDPLPLTLSRVLVDGAPPAGCEECSSDAECGGLVCAAGLCVAE